VNFVEKYLRADIVRGPLAAALDRAGFKTEARLLKAQGEQVTKLLDKAIKEMPSFDPWESVSFILSGGMSPSHRARRQVRGMHFERISKSEKIMLKTLRRAFDSLYKTRTDWNRRAQLQATSRMMKAMIEAPKQKAQSLLAAASRPSHTSPPATKKK
jgi:hypothetical protein